MRAIIFDTEFSSLIFEDEVNILSLCYRIVNSLYVGGQASTNLTFARDSKDFNIKKKIHYQTFSEKVSKSFDHENRLKILNNFLIEIKKLQAIKHASMTTLIPFNGSVRPLQNTLMCIFQLFINFGKRMVILILSPKKKASVELLSGN